MMKTCSKYVCEVSAYKLLIIKTIRLKVWMKINVNDYLRNVLVNS